MSDLPASGYLSNASRTEGEMKDALEDQRDVVAQIPGGSAREDLVISGGVVTPTIGQITVDTEGATSADDLVTIQTTNLPNGSNLLVSQYDDARDVTFKHGTGNLIMRDSADKTLYSTGATTWFKRVGASWIEIYTFRASSVAQRADLGLGNAATATQGSGNGLDADLLDGSHASAFLGVAAQAADSDKLDGIEGANYARKDIATLQSFLANLQATLKVIAYDPSSSTPQFELCEDDPGSPGTPLRRGLLFFDGSDVILRLYQSNGTTIAGSLKITDTTLEWSPDAEATWYEIVSGYQVTSLPSVSNSLAALNLNSNYVSGSVNPGAALAGIMNRFSFFPAVKGGDQGPYEVHMMAHSGSTPQPSAPQFAIRNEGTVARNCSIAWEYLS